VIPGSAADQGAGLQPGDLILAVDGVHISDCDENKLLEAFQGQDVIGSKCILTIERPDVKHLGPLDVEVLRTNASFAKEVELLFLLGQEHASLLQAQTGYDALNASLQAMMHQAVALERHRILHEQVLAARLHSLQLHVIESVTEAEKRIRAVAPDNANKRRIRDLEERWEYVSELLLLLKGPPPVAPAKIVRSIKGCNMGANDLLRILEAMKEKGKSADDVISLIRGKECQDCSNKDLEIQKLRNELLAAREEPEEPLRIAREAPHSARQMLRAAPPPSPPLPPPPPIAREEPEEPLRIAREAPHSARQMLRAAPPPSPPLPPPPPINPPSILPNGGKFNYVVSTTIMSEVAGAKIYYTTDGSPPTERNYEQAGYSPLMLQVEKSVCIRAMCVGNGNTSRASEATFSIDLPSSLAGKSCTIMG
jgi:hypothetical protein